ncbi:MAG: Colicin V production protein [Spirochaetes bacterium ADurb.Bin315]|nr:MAG: Colicin V production protein [Spirochaetes bacterium ADurb.Bin315]HOR79686.1 CvpA family protein [Sphaerochaeta sp.]HPK63460.1 CvpA family protein [Sphaerochaeta sp.]
MMQQVSVSLFGFVFNIVDIIVFVLMIVGGISGAFVGFAQTFTRRGGYLIGFMTALLLTRWMQPFLSDTLGLSVFFSSLLSFVLLFIIGYTLIRLFGSMLENAFEAIGLGGVNAFLGFVWGVCEMVIVSAFILFFLESTSLSELTPYLEQSQFVLSFVHRFMPDTVRIIKETASSL